MLSVLISTLLFTYFLVDTCIDLWLAPGTPYPITPRNDSLNFDLARHHEDFLLNLINLFDEQSEINKLEAILSGNARRVDESCNLVTIEIKLISILVCSTERTMTDAIKSQSITSLIGNQSTSEYYHDEL